MRSGLRENVHWNDYIAHTRRQIWGGNWLSWRVWLATILPYALGAGTGWFIVPYLVDGDLHDGRLSFAIAGIYGAVSAYIVNCLIAPRLQKPLVAEEGVFCGTITLSWNDDDVTISTKGTTYIVSWPTVSGMTLTTQTLFLQLEPYEAIVIPINIFKDDDDLAAFKDYAEARIVAN